MDDRRDTEKWQDLNKQVKMLGSLLKEYLGEIDELTRRVDDRCQEQIDASHLDGFDPLADFFEAVGNDHPGMAMRRQVLNLGRKLVNS